MGLAFTAGGLAALIAFAIAGIFLKPEVDRLAALVEREIGEAGAQEHQRLDHEAFERRLRRWSLIQVTLLVLAISAMATARYIP